MITDKYLDRTDVTGYLERRISVTVFCFYFFFSDSCFHESFPLLDDRHIALFYCLKMEMIRS